MWKKQLLQTALTCESNFRFSSMANPMYPNQRDVNGKRERGRVAASKSSRYITDGLSRINLPSATRRVIRKIITGIT